MVTNELQARIQGLEGDLHMVGRQYNVALQVFFTFYILFEIPSNIFIRKNSSVYVAECYYSWLGRASSPDFHGRHRKLIVSQVL